MSSASAVAEVEYDLSGASLGAWRLEALLGEGAMARIYRARDAAGRVVAVKVLRYRHTGDPELVQRFLREARAVNAVRHPHIVEVYDFGEARAPDGSLASFQVMELLEGQTLLDAQQAGPLPIAEAVRVCAAVARALDAAHRVGVVHRDVKPENVFLSGPAREVKVLDFGMAKLLEPLGELPKSGTMEGVVLGTPEYMAPEQALGHAVDGRADVYAVGVMLYEALLGQRPYAGDTFGKLLVQITRAPVPRLPPTLASGEPVPPSLADAVVRCLAKAPDDRFATAEALAVALETCERPDAERVGPASPATDDAALASAVRPTVWPRVAVAVAAAALAGGALLALLR